MEKALYFMPDISGFTNFVNNTDIEHSIHIIAELLEILLDNAIIDLHLVEIEGDALFMYSLNIPSYESLLHQTTIMLEHFHKHIKDYETKRICKCGACKTAINLKLKFLVHYGRLNFIKVKKIVKPYGRDVIKIHRLLKNKIPLNEYVLFTSNVYELYKNQMDKTWIKANETYDLKNLEYFYKNFENVTNSIKIKDKVHSNKIIENRIPTLTIEKIFNANMQNVYTYISELKYRHLWDKDVKKIDFDNNKINRAGTEHNCIFNIGSMEFETLKISSSDDLSYSENTKDMMFVKDFTYLIKLHSINENKTQIIINLFLDFTTIGNFIKKNILKMVFKVWNKKLNLLEEISKNKNFI